MKTHLIETTGRPMPAICFGMPVVALPTFALEGSDLSFDGIGPDAIRVKSGVKALPASWTSMRDMRATSAFVAAAAANQGYDYAAGAGNTEKNTEQAEQQPQYYARRAFRGPDPWRERT